MRGANLPPFLTTNPSIEEMRIMAKFRLSRIEREKQGIKGIGTILVKCSFCDSQMLISPTKLKRNENHFCQRSCYAGWLSKNQKGEDHPNWQGGDVEVECTQCGESIYRKRAVIKHRKHFFCSKECQGTWKSENLSGDVNYKWKPPVIVNCDFCNKELSIIQSKADGYNHHFCDRSCKAKWNSKNMSGENAYQWSGGVSESRKRFASKPKSRINARMASGMGKALKGRKNYRKWETLAGYTCDDLEKRLRKTMPKGYTWDDFMSGELEIDHIVPQSVFNITSATDLDFKRCWDINNLQLLPKIKNRQKGSKISVPFQMTLPLRFKKCT